MRGMFYKAIDFDHPLGAWNTSAVIDMSFMFYGAESFNQPIGDWDTAHVKDMKVEESRCK